MSGGWPSRIRLIGGKPSVSSNIQYFEAKKLLELIGHPLCLSSGMRGVSLAPLGRKAGRRRGQGQCAARPLSAVPGSAKFFVGERLVDQLVDAKVVKIDRGILLGGWEEHAGKPPTRQTWWCLPGLSDDMTAYP